MNKLSTKIPIFIFIFNFSIFLSANAQWIIQHENTYSYSFHHIAFINRYTGWVCGDGVIMKTTNEGYNWIEQSHDAVDKYLYYIYPVDSNIVYCVGYFETILKTTNGGTNWISIRNGPWGSGASYYTTCFLNNNTGWIMGSSWKLLKTYNGCQSFDSIPTLYPPLYITNIHDIRFKDELTGLLTGDAGQVYKSTNGGYNWNSVNIPLNGEGSHFKKMSVYQNQYCFLVGPEGRIFSSSDFGSNWDSVGFIQAPPQHYFYCCGFANQYTGWAGGEYGMLFKTTNGGHSWREENTNNYAGYNASIYFYDTLIGWVVGGGGKILHTTTGGAPLIYISSNNEHIPDGFKLYQNYPNPFNSQTTIGFEIKENNFYKLIIYNLLGRKVAEILNKNLEKGTYKILYSANNLCSGIYFYNLLSDKINLKRKFVIIK